VTLFQGILVAAIGYLLGSIPSGPLVARARGGVDLTAHGSGRTGATNVLRTLGKRAAAIVLVADLSKGAVAVLAAGALTGQDPWAQLVAAFAAVLGHSYSPFIGFRGGRGVLTGIGATLVAAPLAILLTLVVGSLVIATTRYVSLGSVLGAILGGSLMVAFGLRDGVLAWIVWGILVGGFIVVAHRDNIQRLVAGKERKLGERAGPV
jgi:glycerol-3-phosphate acyltransferase PlsY